MKRNLVLGGAIFLLVMLLAGCALFRIGPSILSITPTSGPAHTVVQIVGSNFGDTQGTSIVTFNGIAAAILSWTSTIITAEVPEIATPGGEPTGAVVIVTVNGRSSNALVFTVVQGISLNPISGAINTSVTISGEGFGNTQGTSIVTFNGIAAAVLAWSDTSITVKVPVIATPDGVPTAASVIVTIDGVPLAPLSFTVIRGILFESYRDGNTEVYMMNPDGSSQTNLTNNPGSDYQPCWSPDGTKIAFETYRDGNGEIYVMNADGTGQTNLTNNLDWDGWPSWSPDGTKIAFETNRDADMVPLTVDPKFHPPINREIYVMNADGSGQTNLTNNPDWDGWASWSPDGTKIAFHRTLGGGGGMYVEGIDPQVSFDGENREIYVMNANGTGQVNLTNNFGWDGMPIWSPNGAKIAFKSDRDGNDEIYVMNPDGSGQSRLTSNSAVDSSPSWSPDGAKIAFKSSRDGNDEIYTMNANGSGQIRLTSNLDWDAGPSWSPDGTKITFETHRDGNLEVYLMNANGSGQINLTNNPDWDGYPVWSYSRWDRPV